MWGITAAVGAIMAQQSHQAQNQNIYAPYNDPKMHQRMVINGKECIVVEINQFQFKVLFYDAVIHCWEHDWHPIYNQSTLGQGNVITGAYSSGQAANQQPQNLQGIVPGNTWGWP